MTSRLLSGPPAPTWVLVFETGDEVMSLLATFARKHALAGSRLTGIGAFSDAVLGYFHWDRKI